MRRQVRVLRFLVWLALPTFLLLTCSELSAQEVGNIIGQVRLAGGVLPSERVLITLQTRGMTINSAFCDNEGRFNFINLLPNAYHLIVNAEGYQPVHQVVVVSPTTSLTAHARIILTPLASSRPESPPAPAPGGNPFLVNPAEYSRKFPREAVKAFEVGMKADQQGKVDKAIRHYEEAIRLAPDFYPARNNLGVRYLGDRSFDEAEKQFTEVLKLNNNDAQAYFNLGNVYYLTKRYDDAKRALQEGLRREPNSALGHYLLGSVGVRTGELNTAERQLRMAIEFDPKMSKVRLELVNLYLQQQKRSDAIEELKSFTKLFPHDPLLPKVKEVLKKLESPPPPAP